jgi:hypothetical protein
LIKVNLLEQAKSQLPKVSRQSSGVAKVLGLTVLLLVLLGLGGGAGYILFKGVPDFLGNIIPVESIELALQKMGASPQPVVQPTSVNVPVATVKLDAVEEVVKSVRTQNPKPAPKQYKQLTPGERVHFQKEMMATMLKRFKEITPSEVGFTDLVFKIPGYYYMNGMAENKTVLASFESKLKALSGTYKSIPVKQGAIKGEGVEFGGYGSIPSVSRNKNESFSLVDRASLNTQLANLKKLATNTGAPIQGFANPVVSKHGLYQRILYRARFKADFSSMIRFMEGLQNSEYPIGILQIAVAAGAEESMVTSIDFIMYLKN